MSSSETIIKICTTGCITVTIKNSCGELVKIQDIKAEISDTTIVQVAAIVVPQVVLTAVNPGTTKLCLFVTVDAGVVTQCFIVIVPDSKIENYTMEINQTTC